MHEEQIHTEIADLVRDLIKEGDEWAKKCERHRNSLDTKSQQEFDEVYRVLTEFPLDDKELEFYIMLESWDTLEENKKLIGLREKWQAYLEDGELPNDKS